LGVLLVAVGGFLDAYSYVNANVFAGAQTGNLVQLTIHLAERDWQEALGSLVPIVAFAIGSSVGGSFDLESVQRVIRNPARAALLLEIALLALVAAPRVGGSGIPMTIVLAFVAGLQMAVFSTVYDWSFSTTVTTSNITKWMSSIVAMIEGRDDSAARDAAAFTGIILAFAVGGIAAAVAISRVGTSAILIAACILLLALAWLVIADRTGDER
jgi:uncharacterized membrane protein YoaK (UPF0700 family)